MVQKVFCHVKDRLENIRFIPLVLQRIEQSAHGQLLDHFADFFHPLLQ